MIRLMCSRDRQKVEALKSELFEAGIRSEIRGNPLGAALGIAMLKIFVDERDFLRATKVEQGLGTVVSADDAAGRPGGSRTINGFVEGKATELMPEAEVLPASSPEPPREESPGCGSETSGSEAEGEFAQVTALLEKEVQALEVRFKDSEQALAAAQARLESQTREFSVQQAAIANLEKEISSRDAQLARMAESLAQARAGMEQERNLRLVAEQKSGALADVRKSLECQLTEQARQREQLLSERRDEHEQMRVCVSKVNDLCSRVRVMRAAREK
jgi:hypothetical protein